MTPFFAPIERFMDSVSACELFIVEQESVCAVVNT